MNKLTISEFMIIVSNGNEQIILSASILLHSKSMTRMMKLFYGSICNRCFGPVLYFSVSLVNTNNSIEGVVENYDVYRS